MSYELVVTLLYCICMRRNYANEPIQARKKLELNKKNCNVNCNAKFNNIKNFVSFTSCLDKLLKSKKRYIIFENLSLQMSQGKGGRLFSSAGHIVPLFVSRGLHLSKKKPVNAIKLVLAGRMLPASRILPPPDIGGCGMSI
jgi:hypothetical protein